MRAVKAAVLEDLDRIVVKEIPTPRPEDNGILVKGEELCGVRVRSQDLSSRQ